MRKPELLKTVSQLAWRNIWRHKRRSFLIISTAVIGLFGVFLMMSFMNSIRKMWVDDAIHSGFLGHVQIRPKGFQETRRRNLIFKEPAVLRDQIQKITIPGKFKKKSQPHFSYRFERNGFLRLGGKIQGLSILGVDIEREKPMSKFDEWIIQGKYLSPPDQKDITHGIIPCLLGEVNAQKFEVEVGDSVILSIGTKEGVSRSIRARIQGIFRSFSNSIDQRTLVVHRKDLSRLYQGVLVYSSRDAPPPEPRKETSYIMYLTNNKVHAKSLADILKSAPRAKQAGAQKEEASGLSRTADILDYTEMDPQIKLMLDFGDQFSIIIYIIMLIGFAFVLLNSVLMSVFERVREIGILRGIGSGPGLIFLMILFECILLGLVGAVMGTIFSYLVILIPAHTGISLSALAAAMELLGGAGGTIIYPSIHFKDIVLGLEVCLIISALASIYPAIKAIKLVPVKAIYNR